MPALARPNRKDETMPVDRVKAVLSGEVDEIRKTGTLKGNESIVVEVIPAEAERGPRFLLEGEGEKAFIKMNSNSYLGMSLRPEVMEAEELAVRRFGAGPGAVRFISGTHAPHVELEARLAAFHGREAGMIFSSAYATVMGVLTPYVTSETVLISDELNHNCIINAMRLSRPKAKKIYKHLDLEGLEAGLEEAAGTCKRAIVVTDGIFSMRGDWASLPEIVKLAQKYDHLFPENVIVMVDDSHGVGAFGRTGRGTEEFTQSPKVDVLVATLGKALGVNGGYVVGDAPMIEYLREKAPFYIYSNPITAGEAAAADKALEILDSPGVWVFWTTSGP